MSTKTNRLASLRGKALSLEPLVEKGNHPPSFERMKRYARTIDMSKQYDVCTVGAGLSGTVLAERSAHLLGKSVLVMDQRPHIGGNLYDFIDPATGVLMNLYGSHLFHTNDQRVWDYLQETSHIYPTAPSWEPWYHQKVGLINGTYVPIPPNIVTVNTLFHKHIQTPEQMRDWLQQVQIPCPHDGKCQNAEEMALSRVGPGLYKAIFETYTLKQWNKHPRELNASVTARIPVRDNFDPRYFSDRYQALPLEGYTAWFEAVLNHPKIDVVLETDFFQHMEHLERQCRHIIYTGPIDRYFDATRASQLSRVLTMNRQHTEGKNATSDTIAWRSLPTEKLEYRSLQFEQERYYHHAGYVLPTPVLNLPGPETPYTRAVEYKQYLHRGGPHSIVVRETSSDTGEPYYPVPTERNQNLYEQYKRLADALERTGRIRFVGRLANYKYFNMDQAIDNALNVFYDSDTSRSSPADWTILVVGENFQAYKKAIHDKMQAHREARLHKFAGLSTKVCQPEPFQGEYGVELRVVVPWYHALSQDCLIQTVGVNGTKYSYFWSDEHTIDPTTQRQNLPLPQGNPFNSDRVYMPDFPYDTPWLAPPFREFFHRADLAERLSEGGKPLLFISNKCRREWRKKVSNNMSLKVLRQILDHVYPKYTIVYKRYTRPDYRDWEDLEKDFADKAMLKREFPDVVLFENLSHSLTDDPEDENLLMYSLLATSERCIVVQGGMAVACAYFVPHTSILIKAGPELNTGGYSYFHRFSNATVKWETQDNRFVNLIETL